MEHVDLWAASHHLDGPRIVALLTDFEPPPQLGDTVTVGDRSGRRIDGRVTMVDGIPGNGDCVEVRFDRSTLRLPDPDSN